jgi:invasion protein IalB
MKITVRLSILFGLVLAFSFGGLRAATMSGSQNTAPSGDKKTTPSGEQKAASSSDKNTASLDQQQMRGLDEQVQEVKSDVLSISQELSRLEEKLLYPSGTQVAIFVALAKGDPMRLDSVRLQIDGQLATQHIYSAKELEALRKGGVQRIYVGNVATGDHQLEVLVEAKLENGKDFSRTERLTFRKEVKPKLVGLTLSGPGSGNTPIALGDW